MHGCLEILPQPEPNPNLNWQSVPILKVNPNSKYTIFPHQNVQKQVKI